MNAVTESFYPISGPNTQAGRFRAPPE